MSKLWLSNDKLLIRSDDKVVLSDDCCCGGSICGPCSYLIRVEAIALSSPNHNLGSLTLTPVAYEIADSNDALTLTNVAEGDLLRVIYRSIPDVGFTTGAEIWTIDLYAKTLAKGAPSDPTDMTGEDYTIIATCAEELDIIITISDDSYLFNNCGHPEADADTCEVSGTGIEYNLDIVEAEEFTCCPIQQWIGYGDLILSDTYDALQTFNQSDYPTPLYIGWSVTLGSVTYDSGVLNIDTLADNKYVADDGPQSITNSTIEVGTSGLGDIWLNGSLDWEAFSVYYNNPFDYIEADGPPVNITWDYTTNETFGMTIADVYDGTVYDLNLWIC